jgi:hypothetical protein
MCREPSEQEISQNRLPLSGKCDSAPPVASDESRFHPKLQAAVNKRCNVIRLSEDDQTPEACRARLGEVLGLF